MEVIRLQDFECELIVSGIDGMRAIENCKCGVFVSGCDVEGIVDVPPESFEEEGVAELELDLEDEKSEIGERRSHVGAHGDSGCLLVHFAGELDEGVGENEARHLKNEMDELIVEREPEGGLADRVKHVLPPQ